MRCRSALVALLLPFTLSAQRPDTTMIPVDLVRALVGASEIGGGRDPQIVVGRIADPSLATVVPKGARVLGGVTYSGQRFGRTTTVLAMAERPDSALTIVSKALEGAGYKAAPTFESAMGQRGGIVSSSSSMVAIGAGMGSAASYCTESASVVASVVEDAGRGSIVRLMSSGVRNTMCDPQMRSRMQRGGMMEEIEMPTLRPPAGVTGGSSGSSGGGDSRTTTAVLHGSLSAGELVDYFAPQLREQGWTLLDRATNGDLSVQTAKRADKNGEPVYLAVSDVRFGPREHDVTLRVWKESQYR